jgi:pyruvate/2-oxoglutarate dehydrogenase complex dihydrolipoamide acyltransferase (E2) component
MPKWGVTMQEGTLTKWNVAEGDVVAEGQILGEIATDKVDAELESPAAGVLTRLCLAAGEVAAVGTVLAIIEEG